MAGKPQSPLESKRFMFVTGKGGVGKTTVCAALALALAARGKRVLVAMCGAHERLSAIPGLDVRRDAAVNATWPTISPALASTDEGRRIILEVLEWAADRLAEPGAGGKSGASDG